MGIEASLACAWRDRDAHCVPQGGDVAVNKVEVRLQSWRILKSRGHGPALAIRGEVGHWSTRLYRGMALSRQLARRQRRCEAQIAPIERLRVDWEQAASRSRQYLAGFLAIPQQRSGAARCTHVLGGLLLVVHVRGQTTVRRAQRSGEYRSRRR